jgi:hypothetical protein
MTRSKLCRGGLQPSAICHHRRRPIERELGPPIKGQQFGGGIIQQLNELTELTEVAPECNALAGSDFIAPSASSSEEEEEAGVEKYQCYIHPWMRAQVRIVG